MNGRHPTRPLRARFVLSQSIILVLLALVSALCFYQQNRHHIQNQNIEHWNEITEHLQSAHKAAMEIKVILHDIDKGIGEFEDPYFAYLEQYQLLQKELDCPSCLQHLSQESQKDILQMIQALRYQDNLQPENRLPLINNLLNLIQTINKSLQAQKRAAYIDYFQSMRAEGPLILVLSASLLILCLVGAAVGTPFFWRSMLNRLNAMGLRAQRYCAAHQAVCPKPHDPLAQLESALDSLADRDEGVNVRGMADAAEEERKRISMAMHDQTLAEVTHLHRQLDSLDQTGLGEASREQIANMRQNLQQLSVNLRQIIDDLHPHTLSVLGLDASVRSLVQKRTAFEGAPSGYVRLENDACAMLTTGQTIHIYRIISEAINNILRHAQCEHFEVVMVMQDNDILLTVEDDGKGMTIPPDHTGHGLLNMQSRAEAIHASIRWEPSRFHSGTRLTIRIAGKHI